MYAPDDAARRQRLGRYLNAPPITSEETYGDVLAQGVMQTGAACRALGITRAQLLVLAREKIVRFYRRGAGSWFCIPQADVDRLREMGE